MIDYTRFEALTFDCYGTLIDWETGIVDGLRPARSTPLRRCRDDELLAHYARSRLSSRPATAPTARWSPPVCTSSPSDSARA